MFVHRSLVSFYQRLGFLMPWVGLAWGICSAFFMDRSYANGTLHFGIYATVFLLLLGVYLLILEDQRGTRLSFFWSFLLQVVCQYILFFCIPFLFLKKQYVWDGLVLVLSGVTLWDFLWQKAIRHRLFRIVMRVITLSMAYGFLFPVFFSSCLKQFYEIFALSILIVAFPYRVLTPAVIKKKFFFLSSLAQMAICVWGCAQSALYPVFRIPVLSVVLKEPYFEIRNQQQWCVHTPVIAPKGLYVPMLHVWYANNTVIDTIHLHTIVRGADEQAFHTWTCKQQGIVQLHQAKQVEVKVFLYTNLYLGTVKLNAENLRAT